MIKELLSKSRAWCKETKAREKYTTLVDAIDHFIYEPLIKTKRAPHIRDHIDLKRWMMLVVIALFPCIFMAILNTGVQSYVYTSKSFSLMKEYIDASSSFSGYFQFIFTKARVWTILFLGLKAFLPLLLISYGVGGLWEALFAIYRKKPIAEGFLVSGMLYPLILPPTLPYWMAALGISLGIIIGKEIFGGTGMNILNPALTCRCFLYFTFPAYMSGEIWAGTNSSSTNESILAMNEAAPSTFDAVSQASTLAQFNLPFEIKRVHTDLIAANNLHISLPKGSLAERLLDRWNSLGHQDHIGSMSLESLKNFFTTPSAEGGLGLSLDNFVSALNFIKVKYGQALFSDGNLFFGNILGSMGETSKIACILGAILLVITGIGSLRTMLSVAIGMVVTASLFKFGSMLGAFQGALNPAMFDFPVYKQFLMGGALFGLVFMATDPVSSPSMKSAKVLYGFLIGALIIIIRMINPAYPEGVMLAILFGNVFAPLLDYYAVRYYRRGYS